MLETIIPFIAGGAVAWVTTYLQHALKVRREDSLREVEARDLRVQGDKDAVAELLGALLDWNTAVANLGLAYNAAANGTNVDWDRVREYQEMVRRFGIVLARTRLSVLNPAARPALDDLYVQHVRMSGHLGLAAFGKRSQQFSTDFSDFQKVIGEARQRLEAACLRWDGSLPDKAIERDNGAPAG